MAWSWRPWQQWFHPTPKTTDLQSALVGYLSSAFEAYLSQSSFVPPGMTEATGEDLPFPERLQMLLEAHDASIVKTTAEWLVHQLAERPALSRDTREMLLSKSSGLTQPVLAPILLDWLSSADSESVPVICVWLSRLSYESSHQKQPVIKALLALWMAHHDGAIASASALVQLDQVAGEVTDYVLQSFPLASVDDNLRLIDLLGKMGRYRMIKPLMHFVAEYPVYQRAVLKAFSRLTYDDIDQFYVRCLEQAAEHPPIVLIEVIKQVRKRRLKRAIPLLDAMFPIEQDSRSVINRAINGEIALTMAAFGQRQWACEKLLPELMLGGITVKYLKAIERLHLEEAVPMIKAILLMPETPEIQHIQHYAYEVCDRLLSSPASLGKSPSSSVAKASASSLAASSSVDRFGPGGESDFLAF